MFIGGILLKDSSGDESVSLEMTICELLCLLAVTRLGAAPAGGNVLEPFTVEAAGGVEVAFFTIFSGSGSFRFGFSSMLSFASYDNDNSQSR